MPRLQSFLECLGQALCEKGRKALQGSWPFADVLNEVARATYDLVHRKLPGDDLRIALQDAASCPAPDLARRIGELIADLAATHAVPFKQELSDYLRAVPPTVRQAFRRPSDPEGYTAPEKLAFYKPDELLVYLPPRLPKFRAGMQPPGLDNWTLTELRGLGECSEVWRGEDPTQPEHSPAALKFAIDPESRDRVKAGTELFKKVFELNAVAGILPLHSVYLESDPPCLESPFVYGYDLTGLMFEWKWRYDGPKPEAALKLVKRLATIIAAAHQKGVVHRDLKPSNVLLHPTEGGKFTMWVTDFGWGQIESVRSLELAKGGPLTAGGPGTSIGGVRVIKNSIGMTFVKVSSGTFAMGTPPGEGGHREHEGPVHEVRIGKSMFVSATPVTQAQYEKVVGRNPAKFNKSHGGGPDHPVETVSWHDAVRFCDMLAQMPDEEIHTRSYRLPTEAEWEYMCRAGSQTAFSFGDKLGAKDGVFAGGGGKYAGKSTGPVGHCTANAFGLHDMHGNVQEWVNDWYDEYYYFESPGTDPQGPGRGTTKVVRGGCWAMFGTDCRSGARRNHSPDKGTETIGFRVIMVVG